MKKLSILLLLVLALGTACEKGEGTPQVSEPQGEESQTETGTVKEVPGLNQDLNVANVLISPKQRPPVLFAVEIASTPSARRQGLQGRENLGEKHGMWFVFDADTQDSFWMKNTPIPLDMIFVDKENIIVDIITDTEPNSEDLLTSDKPYRYVLEAAAGTCEKFGFDIGNSAELRVGMPEEK